MTERSAASLALRQTLSRQVRLRRRAAGLTQRALAARVGYLSAGIITEMEKGNQFPGLEKLILLARVLNCTVGDLLEEQPEAGMRQPLRALALTWNQAQRHVVVEFLRTLADELALARSAPGPPHRTTRTTHGVVPS